MRPPGRGPSLSWPHATREDRYRYLRLGNSLNRRSYDFAFEEVVNCDYRTLNIRLAYIHLGVPIPEGDLYAVPGFDEGDDEHDCRAGLKVIVNAMLHLARPLQNWPDAARSRFPKGTVLNDVKDAIRMKHMPIQSLFEATGIGHRLPSRRVRCSSTF
jgi:hypothetical protein